MRRPVDVKAHFRFLLSVSLFPFSQAASVAILPSALFCERYSLGASWVFSFQWCCYLIIDLCSHRFGGSWAPGLSRSHLDSAVELGSSYPILRHGAYPFPVLIFFMAGLLSVALRARRSLGAYRIPWRPAFSSHL